VKKSVAAEKRNAQIAAEEKKKLAAARQQQESDRGKWKRSLQYEICCAKPCGTAYFRKTK
jgi:hypothetical protein